MENESFASRCTELSVERAHCQSRNLRSLGQRSCFLVGLRKSPVLHCPADAAAPSGH